MNKDIYVVKVSSVEAEDFEIITALASQFEIEGLEELSDGIDIYIKKDLLDTSNWQQFERMLKKNHNASIVHELLEDKNWNAIWESEFHPIRINDFAKIRAPFHDADSDVANDLIIQPKMSFGTGHHATTFLMISVMESLSFDFKRVLDLGSGTAVLGILAKKLNAKKVIALDNDEWCYKNGQENAQLNDVGIEIVLGEINNIEQQTFDIVLANINRNYFLEKMAQIADIIESSGIIVMSGFLLEDVQRICDCAVQNSIRMNAIEERNGWLCMVGQKI